MTAFEDHLSQRLEDDRAQGLYRDPPFLDGGQGVIASVHGRACVNFSSNDYLGLASDSRLAAAADDAARRFGGGAGASRLISGGSPIHRDLESELARLKRAEAALAFSSGYAAAHGVIPALMGTADTIILDKLCHASLIDASRLAGSALRVFRHNDMADLEKKLRWAQSRRRSDGRGKILVVAESVYSMDGDLAPLADLVTLKNKRNAWLMIDEAHATGVYGPRGEGLVGEHGLDGDIEIQMGTLSKALGAAGGFICGSALLKDFLINHARTFIFSTAPAPAAAAAALAGARVVLSRDGTALRRALRDNVAYLEEALGWSQETAASPIIPIALGDERAASAAAEALREAGYLAPAIRYPSVGRGKARLRVTVSARHTQDQILGLARALRSCVPGPIQPL